jgi:ABC-type bacteriocin/lantibiotic exporter with double-glycine peptidase domain
MRRKWLPPEVIQVSMMECGPACLTSIAKGWGLNVSLDRLREHCQLSVDGTSIDNIEEIGQEIGLESEQITVPREFLKHAPWLYFPAIVVERNESALLHFTVWWRQLGSRLAVMDPAQGRIFYRYKVAEERLYDYKTQVPANAWREWAGEQEWSESMRAWAQSIGVASAQFEALLREALADPSWLRCAQLDACLRLIGKLVEQRKIRRTQIRRIMSSLWQFGVRDGLPDYQILPRRMWGVTPGRTEAATDDGEEEALVSIHGAILCRFAGGRKRAESRAEQDQQAKIVANLRQDQSLGALRYIRPQDWVAMSVAACITSFGVLPDLGLPLLMRGIGDLNLRLSSTSQRAALLATLAIVLTCFALAEFLARQSSVRISSGVLARGLMGWYAKIPRLPEQFFRTRVVTDLEDRIFGLGSIAAMPARITNSLRSLALLLVYLGGCLWLAPDLRWLILIFAATNAIIMAFHLRALMRTEKAGRVHESRLSAVLLDAFAGASALSAHSGEDDLLHRQEENIRAWLTNEFRQHEVNATMRFYGGVWSTGWVIAILAHYLSSSPSAGTALLFVYFLLQIPGATQGFSEQTVWVTHVLNTVRRLSEIVTMPTRPLDEKALAVSRATARGEALGIALDSVSFQVGGVSILSEVTLRIEPGEHVAVVGRSGAGKSSLISLLNGATTPSSGALQIGGKQWSSSEIWALRSQIAWVDPGAALWNQSLAANLEFGNESGTDLSMAHALAQVDLLSLLESLEHGMQTDLGERGLRLSGGEGQRVRLARALRHQNVGLVLLDEAFRGLERSTRRVMHHVARDHWAHATLISISHDVADTIDFPRVLVFEDGRLIEDGAPQDLLADPTTRYASLVDADRRAVEEIWGRESWQHLRLERGKFVEGGRHA